MNRLKKRARETSENDDEPLDWTKDDLQVNQQSKNADKAKPRLDAVLSKNRSKEEPKGRDFNRKDDSTRPLGRLVKKSISDSRDLPSDTESEIFDDDAAVTKSSLNSDILHPDEDIPPRRNMQRANCSTKDPNLSLASHRKGSKETKVTSSRQVAQSSTGIFNDHHMRRPLEAVSQSPPAVQKHDKGSSALNEIKSSTPMKRLTRPRHSDKERNSDSESETFDFDSPIVTKSRISQQSDASTMVSQLIEDTPIKYRRLRRLSKFSPSDQNHENDSDYDFDEPVSQSSRISSSSHPDRTRSLPHESIIGSDINTEINAASSLSSSASSKVFSQPKPREQSPWLGEAEIIDIMFGDIFREDRAEDFLRALFDDVLGLLISSPALAGFRLPTIPLYNFFLACCAASAQVCMELMMIISAIIGDQMQYSPNLTIILKQMISSGVHPEICSQYLRRERCSDKCLLEWRMSKAFSTRLQDVSYNQNMSADHAKPVLENLSKRQISAVIVLCDYAPVYAYNALCTSSPSADTQLFDLININDAHLISLLMHRLDVAFRRRHYHGGKYALDTFKFREKLLSKHNEYAATRVTSAEVLNLLQVVDKASGGMVIHWAAEEGLIDLVHELLTMAPTLGIARDDSGMTILHSAAMMGHSDLLSHLITHHKDQINIRATDNNEWTALMYAIYREQIGCVRLLLDNDSTNGEFAFQQMEFLEQSIPSERLHSPKMKKMIEALATVPEFRSMLNAAVRYALSCDKDLKFIQLLPSLLDVDNKLSTARRSLVKSMDWLRQGLFLSREDPWISLLDYLNGSTTASGKQVSDSETSANIRLLYRYSSQEETLSTREERAAMALRSLQRQNLMLQFVDEVGAGPGIEKEVFELISEKLVHGSMSILGPSSEGGNIVIPLDSPSLSHPHTIPNTLDEIHRDSPEQEPKEEIEDEEEDSVIPDLVVESSQSLVVDRTKPSSYREHLSQIHESLSDYSDDEEEGANVYSIDDDEEESEREVITISDSSSMSEATIPLANSRLQPPWQRFYPDSYDPCRVPGDAVRSLESRFIALGCLVAHILIRQVLRAQFLASLSLDLPHAFWQLVLRRDISLYDIADLDADVFRNLVWLEENGGADALSLTFSALANTDDGSQSSKVIDLVLNGSDLDVTDANKKDYILLMTRHCVCMKMSAQADYLRAGILSLLPEQALDLFTAREVMGLVSGETAIIVEDWQAVAVYSGGYHLDSEIIGWFWEFVAEFPQNQLSALLQFWTGSTRLPVGGFKNLQPAPCIMRKGYDASTALPTSATCFNMLKLPHYPEKHLLRKHLHTAIVYGSQGFAFT